jgi:D-cysteine desulfhydrase
MLSRRLGADIWIKRDDLNGFAMGGNKARKAEFLLADALQKKCDVVLTAGAMQSNHVRVIAAASKRFSLECHLFLSGSKPDQPTANLLLDLLADAQIHTVPSEERPSAMEVFAEQLQKKGRRPYIIPIGGSNEIGGQGYVLGIEELERQLQALPSKPTTLVFASASGGTHAGILAGLALIQSKVKHLGILVDRDPNLGESVCTVANALAKRLGLVKEFQRRDVSLNSDYLGEDYGIPSKEGMQALKELWQREGILLEPVYTAKAMAGLIGLVQKGEWSGERVVFLHSGGIPSVFSFPPAIQLSFPSPIS